MMDSLQLKVKESSDVLVRDGSINWVVLVRSVFPPWGWSTMTQKN